MRTRSPAELLWTRMETSMCSVVDLQLLKDHATFVIFPTFFSVINWPGCLPLSDVYAYRSLFHFPHPTPSFQVSQAFVRPTTPEKDKEAHREVVR